MVRGTVLSCWIALAVLAQFLLFSRVFVSWAPWIQIDRFLEFIVTAVPLCIHAIAWKYRSKFPQVVLRMFAWRYFVASVALFVLTVFLLDQWVTPVVDVTHPDFRPAR